ncbi:MAG: methyltransferase domain-containing protein [Planctomycetota bacterium]
METYFIKAGYEHRTRNATLEETAGDYWTPYRLAISRHAQYAVYRRAATLIRAERLRTVIDVGCGVGHKLAEMIAPLPEVEGLVGVDQPSCVEVAGRLFPSLKLVTADFEQPADSGLEPADLVMSVDVIEHLLDPDLLLDFMKRHMHAESWALLSTPERDVRRGPDNMKSKKAEHVREWNRGEFAAYLDDRGFEVVEHVCLPAFRVGGSWRMMKDRWRLLRKGISHRYSQVAICRLKPGVSTV